MRRLLPSAVLFGVLFTCMAGAASAAPPVFTHGVSSGDVTSRTAFLWTRVDQAVELKAEVSKTTSFASKAFTGEKTATAGNDFTAKILAYGLSPNTKYYFRWRKGSTIGPVGTFKTAPSSSSSADVKFAYTGDSDGTLVGGIPFHNNFEVLDAVRAESPDFFGYIGDTIYSDSSLRPGGLPATTLSEYRDAYKVNRTYTALKSLLAATSTYVQADDHEIQNDYDGQTVDPARYAAGREAFVEYFPIATVEIGPIPGCAGVPMFRAFHWGSDVDVIIPDERTCRSPDAAVACLGDLAPTLPAPYRMALGFAASPPAGCLTALNDPSKTMLGSAQKALFKAALNHSTAKFKFVLSELAIQQFFALPYDRWEGYAAERTEILNYIRDNSIDNVVFLTTDNHANLMNDVFVDRFTDSTPIAFEAITGPIATFSLEQEILGGFGAGALTAFNIAIGPLPGAVFPPFFPAGPNGVDCRELNKDSYGMVDVDASAGTATITFKDDSGAVIIDDGAPTLGVPSSGPCVKVIGP